MKWERVRGNDIRWCHHDFIVSGPLITPALIGPRVAAPNQSARHMIEGDTNNGTHLTLLKINDVNQACPDWWWQVFIFVYTHDVFHSTNSQMEERFSHLISSQPSNCREDISLTPHPRYIQILITKEKDGEINQEDEHLHSDWFMTSFCILVANVPSASAIQAEFARLTWPDLHWEPYCRKIWSRFPQVFLVVEEVEVNTVHQARAVNRGATSKMAYHRIGERLQNQPWQGASCSQWICSHSTKQITLTSFTLESPRGRMKHFSMFLRVVSILSYQVNIFNEWNQQVTKWPRPQNILWKLYKGFCSFL